MIDLDKLKEKEIILDKLARVVASELIWASNKGMADVHKEEIVELLTQYYKLIYEKEI